MPFQNTIHNQPAPGLPGDFASANPWANVLAGPGALVAGPAGLQPGRFAWVDPSGTYASNTGSGAPAGFVKRTFGEGFITTYLAETGSITPAGFEVSLYKAGEFWALNSGTAPTAIGQKVYANFADGTVTTGPSGNPPTGASVTGSVAPGTATFTGSIAVGTTGAAGTEAGNYGLLSVTGVANGSTLQIGGAVTGTGVAAGTTITSQLSGTTGGVGTYAVNIPQTVASTTLTEAYGVLTVTATASGSLGVGDTLAGTGVNAGTAITAPNGAGSYIVNSSQTVASTTLTAAGGVETKWLVGSIAAPGEVFKITTWAQG